MLSYYYNTFFFIWTYESNYTFIYELVVLFCHDNSSSISSIFASNSFTFGIMGSWILTWNSLAEQAVFGWIIPAYRITSTLKRNMF